jgi:hypothetical protein
MAMDHPTKAATTSNILLVVVGAIITLMGFNKEISTIGGVVILIIGIFGMAWA